MLAGTTNYTLHGKNIVPMTQGSNSLHFYYDASNKPAIVEINGTKYAYVHNLQGDIVAILDNGGNIVVQYKYDAWGRPINCSGSMANTLGKINPFRYRGYVYDEEAGLYYLRSRYYNAAIYHFLNADSVVTPKHSLCDGNVFAYCYNNPICRSDPSGHWWDDFKRWVSSMLHQGNHASKSLGIDTAAAGALALNMEQDGQGIYYARSNCWQRYVGYNDVYDFFFDIGTEMDKRKFPFSIEIDGQSSSYVLWLWQGDYINLGGGAEMGIYRGKPNWHCTVDTNMTFPMTISVYYEGEHVFTRSDNTWWITGFMPSKPMRNPADITAIYTIDFSSDINMYEGFKDAWGPESKGETWTFDDSTHTATFSF